MAVFWMTFITSSGLRVVPIEQMWLNKQQEQADDH
jgi:hypothetical protein